MNTKELYDIEQYILTGKAEKLSSSSLATLKSLFKKNNKYQRDASLNDFDVMSVIGNGSCSTVYLAKTRTSGDLCALKVIEKSYIAKYNLFDEITLEKNILSALEHPFLSQMKFYFQTPTKICFVLPFYKKGDLFQYLSQKKTLSESMVAFIGVQVAYMLDFLHNKNIIYRDLKPENLMITDDGYLHLIDFGLCKIMANKTDLSASFCGCAEYVSPEIVNGDGHNRATDWWSFGVLMYELLFGETPFHHEQLESACRWITEAELKFNPSKRVSDNAKDLLMKLLMKDPTERLGYQRGCEEVIMHPFFQRVSAMNIKTKKAGETINVDDSEELTGNFDPLVTGCNVDVSDNVAYEEMEVINRCQQQFEDMTK
jgi:serine/threonine protein kinase